MSGVWNVTISLTANDDTVSLENDERMILRYVPESPEILNAIELAGEYIRDTATVTITDTDG